MTIPFYGIGRSLWLDEAWVANSVLSPTLSGMFYYSDWLQTTPPLFLLLTRAAVHVFGLSNISLRIVPFALALIAVAGLFAAARRLMSPAFAVLACSLLASHPVAIEYARTCKQYSGEMAASAIILWLAISYVRQPSAGRFYGIACAFALTLPLAYSTAFLLPGVAVAVYAQSGIRRAGLLVLIASGVLALLYVFFIRQNLSPELRAFWIANSQGLTPGLLATILFCIGAGVWAMANRSWVLVIALLPCLLLAASNALHWYPNSPRTRLFALPCFLLAAMIICQNVWGRRRATAAIWIVALVVPLIAAWTQVRQHRNQPEEDFAGAVQFLRQHVGPRDLLLVHASVKEGFKLYAAINGWKNAAIYGDTGYPCCRRDKPSTRTAVEDLDSKIPNGFRGRIWLLYSTRPTQWSYTGLDEGKVWRSHVWDKGCPPARYVALPNLAIGEMDCGVEIDKNVNPPSHPAM